MTLPWMRWGALVGGLFCLAVAPSAPPTIIHVKTSGLCTALRENVAPTLLGLMNDDQIIARVLSAAREAIGDPRNHVSQLVVENAVAAIVHNLAVIDTLLQDPRRFPSDPKDPDEQMAALLKRQLQAIADRQKTVLNALNGTIETLGVSDMQHTFPNGTPFVGPGAAAILSQKANLGNAGLAPDAASPNAGSSREGMPDAPRTTAAVLEARAADTIKNAVVRCRSMEPTSPDLHVLTHS